MEGSRGIERATRKTRKVLVGGVIVILSGTLLLLFGVLILALNIPSPQPIMIPLGAGVLACSMISIFGGIAALDRRDSPLALIGSMLPPAIFLSAYVLEEMTGLIVPGLVSLSGVVLLVTSRKEFAPGGRTGFGNRTCVECGRSIDWDVNVCPHCGHDFRKEGGSGKSFPYIGGGFTLGVSIASIVAVIWWLGGCLEYWGLILVSSWLISAVMGIAGGIAGLVRRVFPLALIGSVFAIWGSISILFVIGPPFAIVGLVFTAISRKRFRKLG